MTSLEDIQAVSPALARYTQGPFLTELWNRPSLSPRNRSIVTVAALIACRQTSELPFTIGQALDHGVMPGEISEIITHLAFYSGWPNALAAIEVTKTIFADRGIGGKQLPAALPEPLPINQKAEDQREATVKGNFGAVCPGLVQYTRELLFNDLWLRPGLAPRDRSLVTISALIASGQVAQVTYHLNRAMDNGLTQEEAGEVVSHLAFYVGWSNAFSAAPVLKDVFEKRVK